MAPHTSDNQKADEATMTTVIRQDDLIESVADALQFISYYHPKDFIQAVYEAYQKEESQAAKDTMAQILINSRMCAQGHRPICQDTGIVTVFVNIGMDVKFECDMALDDVINEGVRRAYTHPDNVLRASVLADPDGKRQNTKDNTPAIIHYKMVPGNTVDVHVAAKGGGDAKSLDDDMKRRRKELFEAKKKKKQEEAERIKRENAEMAKRRKNVKAAT